MENLNDVYAVVGYDKKVIDILENFDDAYDLAEYYHAECIETLEGIDGDRVYVYPMDYGDHDFLKQKIIAIALLFISAFSVPLTDGDITFLLFMVMFVGYLFFSKNYWINDL